MAGNDILGQFTAPTQAWFTGAFAGPTAAQSETWAATAAGESVLVSAPTGSGKTLAAFLTAVDGLMARTPGSGSGATESRPGTRVLYVSPLKALAYDVDRNLRAPLVGITRAGERLGVGVPEIEVAMRTGDTPADERRRQARHPPDILITTPESLFLLLTSNARETLTDLETVIVDEVHAVAGAKRGAHLALSLERLEALTGAADRGGSLHGSDGRALHGSDGRALQRIGLSATQRPLEEVARFLGGGRAIQSGGGHWRPGGQAQQISGGRGDESDREPGSAESAWQPRPVRIVAPPAEKALDIEIVVPVEDMSRLGELADDEEALQSGPAAAGTQTRRSIWPAVQPRILELIQSHRSTIVFCNSRRLAERLCASLNELAGADDAAPVARAHHGSVAREERTAIESDLKAGQLRCVVATSSLELGIDMGTVDLVIQVESPGSVSRGLQRIGRAGHHVDAPSTGKIFPKYRGDLLEAAVVTRRMQNGEIEHTHYPRNPLDVLAQQLVAMAAMDEWDVDALLGLVRGAASFADLTRAQLDGVLDLLSGRYPSDEFAELRPRVTWDRVTDRIAGRSGAQRLAVTSGGTIPDRGLYGVFLAGEEGPSRRVGELDEEMVYETRPGETFTLGTSTWRVEDITRDQVLVSPAPGEPGKLPFWHGDAPGRPVEVGRALGAFVRELDEAPANEAVTRLEATGGLDERAASNLVAYLDEQRDTVGVVPSDRTVVIERFRDEIGDWRVCVLSPFGGQVHAPWALAIEARLRERLGHPVQTMAADDGIVIRVPDQVAWDGTVTTPDAPPADAVVVDPDEVEDLVLAELGDSALFAARFRECAARALLLPRRRPGGRTPLWQQRQRAADLLAVARRYGQFPILLETYRECLRDVFDVPALHGVLSDIAARRIRVHQVDTPQPSPFAASLQFGYVAGYLYEGDAPLAERRAHALSLDRELLAELLGSGELRELIDADALASLELEVQRLADDRRARSADELHDLLREVGDLRPDEAAARADGPAEEWLEGLADQRRAYRLGVAGERRWAAAEDAARFRDALGVPPPAGLPEAFLEPIERPLVDLVSRYARTHGPFRAGDVAGRLGLPLDAVELAGKQLESEGRLVAGEFRPGGVGQEWCDAEVLRRLRRRSLATLRREVEPVEPSALGRFLPAWQGVRVSTHAGHAVHGAERLAEVVEQLQGAPVPASVLETDVLATRIGGYTPAWLDELTAAGEVVWLGRGPLGARDGKVSLYLRDQAPALAPAPAEADERSHTGTHAALLAQLSTKGACFWPALYEAAGGGAEQEVLDALWDLVWAGMVTNDTFAPVRALAGGAGRSGRTPRTGRGGRRRRPGRAIQRSGPPEAAGRWGLVTDLTEPRPPGTEAAAALAAQLLDRHGVLTRDAVAAEGVHGGFSTVYGVLTAMEEAGRARRGYFVEGLGGAQFAVPGAVDRLRAVRDAGLDEDAGAPVALAATDPANPYGAALPWPAAAGGRHQPRRVAGAYVVLVEGHLVAYLERGGRSALTFTDDPDALDGAAVALAGLVDGGRLDRLSLQRIDGDEPTGHPFVAALRTQGFVDHPRGLVRRRT